MMSAFYYSMSTAFEDAELWFGPHPTREAASVAATARHPGSGYWTAEAAPQANELDIFTPAMAAEGGAIAEAFNARNEQTFGEDGEGGPTWWSDASVETLIKRLNYQFATWAAEYGYQRGWMLDITEERWTPPAPAAAPPSSRSVLSLAYDRERAA